MATHFSCQCGSRIRIGHARPGQKGRCPKCGDTFIVPASPEFDSKGPTPLKNSDDIGGRVRDLQERPNIRTPGWLLYLGLMTATSILWGTLATLKLQSRTREMQEALSQADAAAKAAKVSIAEAEAIKKQASEEIGIIRRDAEAVRKQPEITRLQAEEQFLERHSNARKLVPGEILVRERYLESFTIESGTIHFKFRNTSELTVKPDLSILFFDKDGAETQNLNISWFLTTIDPGQTSSDEATIRPKLGPPVYYALSVRDGTHFVATNKWQPSEPILRRPSEPIVAIGDQIVVQAAGDVPVFLATSDAAWYEMLDATSAKSAELVARLILQGKVIAPKGGTAGVVVKTGVLSTFVLIKEGPYAGREGWIPSEFVKPFNRR
jgi:hypothetical protein